MPSPTSSGEMGWPPAGSPPPPPIAPNPYVAPPELSGLVPGDPRRWPFFSGNRDYAPAFIVQHAGSTPQPFRGPGGRIR